MSISSYLSCSKEIALVGEFPETGETLLLKYIIAMKFPFRNTREA